VALAGELEGTGDSVAVDRHRRKGGVAVAPAGAVFARRGVELFDHGEEVGEELALR
jgi:hypothetical protein